MKMRIMTNRAMGCLLCVMTLSAMAAEISDVVVKQRWPWSRLVDINYVLTDDSNHKSDIVLTVRNGSQTLTLPSVSLSGDLYGVGKGQRHIVWDPTVTQYTNDLMLTQFSVDLASTTVPLYMIVDLTKSEAASGQVEYVYESDLTNGLWGAWVRNPVTNNEAVIESVIWTGVTTNDSYKTDKLVLRRIPEGSYTMGWDGTKACYAGVFEVTDAQWAWVMGGSGTSDPKVEVSYNDIRGATTSSIDWPATGSKVSPTSFLGKLRLATGIDDFDLPTKAQWEYLCRAGTTTAFNDGSTDARYDGTVENNNGNTNGYLSALGWYKFNCDAIQPVGQKAANAWGLYDAHGSTWEWCLDWSGGTTFRTFRGGSWTSLASLCHSALSTLDVPAKRFKNVGFRLVRTLP